MLKAEQSSTDQPCYDLDIDDQFADMDICSGWSDGDRLVLRACVGVVKTAGAALKKVSKSIAVSGQSHNAPVTFELDSYVEMIEAVSPAVDDLVSSLYPPVSLPTVQTHVSLLLLMLSLFRFTVYSLVHFSSSVLASRFDTYWPTTRNYTL